MRRKKTRWTNFGLYAAAIARTASAVCVARPVGHGTSKETHVKSIEMWGTRVQRQTSFVYLSKGNVKCRVDRGVTAHCQLTARTELGYDTDTAPTFEDTHKWIKIDLIISLFTAQRVSNVSTFIFRSLQLIVDLFHVLYCSGSMCVGVTVWFGWGGVVSLCRLKHCFIQPL